MVNETYNTDAPTPPEEKIFAYAVKLPQFWPRNPEVYFEQIEATFRTSKITVSRTKYDYLLQAIPGEVMENVMDVLVKCRTCDTPYEELKKQLIQRHSVSESSRVEQLLSDLEIGDRKPSEFFRSMSNTARNAPGISEDLVKTLWLRRLPQGLETLLKPFVETKDIDAITKLADELHDVQKRRSTVASVNKSEEDSRFDKLQSEMSEIRKMIAQMSYNDNSSRSRSRSKSRDRKFSSPDASKSRLCYFHFKFGDEATKCKGQPCPRAGEMAGKTKN